MESPPLRPLSSAPEGIRSDVGEGVDYLNETRWRVLQVAARLLLEYNERSALITRHLGRLASRLDIAVSTVVEYRAVTLAAPDGRMFRAQAPELRINMAVSIDTLRTIDDLCAGRIAVDEGLRRLESVEHTSVQHGKLVVTALFGLAAAALAAVLGGDGATIASSGGAAALGVFARQEIAKRTSTLLLTPFVAALVGALVGALVIRADWTLTQSLCLIVPALMVVPGPHLINGVEDILENEIEAGICRLCLATAILVAAALGVAAGLWLIFGAIAEPASSGRAVTTALVNIGLAGVASAGFAALQNSPWRVVWVSIACGAIGYAIRSVSLASGTGLAMASVAACLAIGIAAGIASNRLQLPFAPAAFAGAAPLMPGLSIYGSIAAAVRMAKAGSTADPTLAVAMLSPLVEAAFVVAAMVIGLVIGSRVAGLARWSRPKAPPPSSDP
jgi:uncharacterized membrane protein YjjP (DUF1212 family)